VAKLLDAEDKFEKQGKKERLISKQQRKSSEWKKIRTEHT